MAVSKELEEKLISRAKQEYDHALKYRQKREREWQTIDDLYYGKKKKSFVTRANVHIPKMQGTIDVFLAKIDESPFIEYDSVEEGDMPKVVRMNALLRRDMNIGDWDLIDVVGKKEAALYGRTIYKKFSTSENGFTDHFENVDVLDFLIDPTAGGVKPMTDANYCGHDNIIRSKWDLSDSKIYNQNAVEDLAEQLKADSDTDSKNRSKQTRRAALNLNDAVLILEDSMRLVEWYTTFEGKRYYLLFSPEHNISVRTIPLKEIFASNEFPFATWAPFPRIGEFWTPGLGEMIKEINIVQNILMNQMLDNNAFRNYGMKAYDKNKVPNPDMLTPRPMGKVPVNGNPRDIIMDIPFPAIDQGISMYNLAENVFSRETGVSEASKGMPNSKRMSATEFAGLLDQTADRFFTANKTYKHALRRIAYLYKLGIEENMTRKRRVRILGARGWDWKVVSNDDAKIELDVLISTGASKENSDNLLRDRFRDFRAAHINNERMNQRFLDEKEARLLGLEENEIQRLMNPELEGNWEIMAEAASENEELLKKKVKPNRGADMGHVQKHIDYARDTDLKPSQVTRILAHANAEIDMAIKNEEANARKIADRRRAQVKEELGNFMERPGGEEPVPVTIAPPGTPGAVPVAPASPGGPAGAGSQAAPFAPPISSEEQVRFDAISAAPLPAANAGGII